MTKHNLLEKLWIKDKTIRGE